jgi:uncharacterized damage-inducible protein DinB
MTNTPVPPPIDPPATTDEATMLGDYLDFYRTVLLRKGDGLSPDQLQVRLGPSTLSIGALIRHMTLVEDSWFWNRFEGHDESAPWIDAPWEADRDWEMTTAAGMKFDELRAHFEATCQRSRDVVERAESLDALQKLEGSRGPTSLRWILIHLIEEYARHVGHADLIRESIDGQVGD